MIWDAELFGQNVSCKAWSSWKLEILSHKYAALSHKLMGDLQDDLYLCVSWVGMWLLVYIQKTDISGKCSHGPVVRWEGGNRSDLGSNTHNANFHFTEQISVFIFHYYILLHHSLLHIITSLLRHYYILLHIHYYLLLHHYYVIITSLLCHYYIHYYILLQFHYYLLLHHYYVIITSLLRHYYVIITSLLRNYYISIITCYYAIITPLLRHYYVIITFIITYYYNLIIICYYIIITSLLRHYYVIITSLLQMPKMCNNESIITYYCNFCFHYNVIITHYYHYDVLLRILDRATCRCILVNTMVGTWGICPWKRCFGKSNG